MAAAKTKPARARADGAKVRAALIATGVLREGTGAALTRADVVVPPRRRCDDAAHYSAAVEIWCCERDAAIRLLAVPVARVAPGLVSSLESLSLAELHGVPVIFTPREPWLRSAMAGDDAPELEALAS